jgi:hypothetical protein
VYVGDAKSYLQAYSAALISARKDARSLLPVVVYEGPPPPETCVDWAESQGAIVLNHNLTFRAGLIKSLGDPELAHTRSLWGSYLRLEPQLIMDKLIPHISRTLGVGALAGIDTDHVLWTDPDVIFYKDINSCTIPSPHILSVGPEASRDGVGNCGVIYFNLAAYR